MTLQTLFFPVHRVDFEAPIAFGNSQSPFKHHSTGIISICFNSFSSLQPIPLLRRPCCVVPPRHARTTKHTSHFTRLRIFARRAAKSRLTTHRDHHRYLPWSILAETSPPWTGNGKTSVAVLIPTVLSTAASLLLLLPTTLPLRKVPQRSPDTKFSLTISSNLSH